MFIDTLKNNIMNGGLHFWQRGSSFASVVDATYTADRWKYKKSGTMVHTVSRSTDVPSNSITPYSLLATVTTAQASLGTTGLCCIQQFIEGNFASNLYGKKVALSFYVKASKIGTYCVRFANSAKDKVIVKEFSVSVANTWEKKIIRISHDFTGTWLKDIGIGMEVSFVIGAGSNYNSASNGTWISSDLYATANQVNGLDTIGNTFQLAEVVLIEDNSGQTTVPNFVLAGRNYSDEMRLCQRYFEKSYELETAPGTSGTSAGAVLAPRAETVTANRQVFHQKFNSVKRTIPAISNYSYLGVINSVCQYNSTGTNISYNINSGIAITQSGFNSNNNIAVTTTGGVEAVMFHWTADAEL